MTDFGGSSVHDLLRVNEFTHNHTAAFRGSDEYSDYTGSELSLNSSTFMRHSFHA